MSFYTEAKDLLSDEIIGKKSDDCLYDIHNPDNYQTVDPDFKFSFNERLIIHNSKNIKHPFKRTSDLAISMNKLYNIFQIIQNDEWFMINLFTSSNAIAIIFKDGKKFIYNSIRYCNNFEESNQRHTKFFENNGPERLLATMMNEPFQIELYLCVKNSWGHIRSVINYVDGKFLFSYYISVNLNIDKVCDLIISKDEDKDMPYFVDFTDAIIDDITEDHLVKIVDMNGKSKNFYNPPDEKNIIINKYNL